MTVKELRGLLTGLPLDAEVRLVNAIILNEMVANDRKEPSDMLTFPVGMVVRWPSNGRTVYVVGR